MKYRPFWKRKTFWLAFAVIYLVLVCILWRVETGLSNSNICNFGDALWYSLVTITTVGYGDMTPQSLVGKLIGGVFLVMSVGVLAALFNLLFELLRGSLWPRFKLWTHRKQNWNVFSFANNSSLRLAQAVSREEPSSITIFLQEPPQEELSFPYLVLPMTPENLIRRERGGIRFFCFGDDYLANQHFSTKIAECIHENNIPEKQRNGIYCLSDQMENVFFSGVDYFNPSIACARRFWRKHPLQKKEQEIVFIGGSRWMPSLLEQALLVNIYDINQTLHYHVFGDDGSFFSTHYRMETCFEPDLPKPGRDAVTFHKGFFPAELLLRADRIILCQDTDEENISLLRQIRKYIPLTATIYLHLEHHLDLPQEYNAQEFGVMEHLLTPEIVLHHSLDLAARKTNERYNLSHPDRATDWDMLSDYSRNSNLAAADHILVKLHILLPEEQFFEVTPELCARAMEVYWKKVKQNPDPLWQLEHLRWCRYLVLRNWSFDKERNNKLRKHDLLKPYSALTLKEKQSNADEWEAIEHLFDPISEKKGD